MQAGNINGDVWRKNRQVLNLTITTNEDRLEVAEIIKENLEKIGIKVNIRKLSNSYYKNNLEKLHEQIVLTGNTVSIKPEITEYLKFNIEQKQTLEDTYKGIYEKYNQEPNFMGLYFNSLILLSSKNLKGNLEGNWYNIFYNIDTWQKIEE